MSTPNENIYVLSHDIGTTGSKTCLIKVGATLEIVDDALAEYPVQVLDNGGVEQNPVHSWDAICQSTRAIIQRNPQATVAIKGISFCTQMQAFIPVDSEGTALRPAMSYMDHRAEKQLEEGIKQGFIKFTGFNLRKLLKFIRITGVAPLSVKDPIWKYLWVKEKEPNIFKQMSKWYDAKEFLLHQATGHGPMTYDSAFTTMMFDSRDGKFSWPQELFDMLGVDINHMPELIKSTDIAGHLTAKAAAEMDLPEGIPVFGGGGDASLIPIGAGCSQPGDTHVYVGTSGWVSAQTPVRMVDPISLVASLVGAIPNQYSYMGVQETSGICLQWVKDHLALDEIDVYLNKEHVAENKEKYKSLYDYMSKVVEETEPGAGGVIFTPWLRGNRCPFDDPNSRGMFFNIGLDTGKRMLIRSVLEGVTFQKRWMLESINKKISTPDTIRFVGGGANSPTWCQIMADILGCTIEVPGAPQNAGAVGSAAVCTIGLGLIDSFDDIKKLIPAKKVYQPRLEYQTMYNRQYQVFKTLYKNNKNAFAQLNRSQITEEIDSETVLQT